MPSNATPKCTANPPLAWEHSSSCPRIGISGSGRPNFRSSPTIEPANRLHVLTHGPSHRTCSHTKWLPAPAPQLQRPCGPHSGFSSHGVTGQAAPLSQASRRRAPTASTPAHAWLSHRSTTQAPRGPAGASDMLPCADKQTRLPHCQGGPTPTASHARAKRDGQAVRPCA